MLFTLKVFKNLDEHSKNSLLLLLLLTTTDALPANVEVFLIAYHRKMGKIWMVLTHVPFMTMLGVIHSLVPAFHTWVWLWMWYRGSPNNTNFWFLRYRVIRGIVLSGDWFSTKSINMVFLNFKDHLFSNFSQ